MSSCLLTFALGILSFMWSHPDVYSYVHLAQKTQISIPTVWHIRFNTGNDTMLCTDGIAWFYFKVTWLEHRAKTLSCFSVSEVAFMWWPPKSQAFDCFRILGPQLVVVFRRGDLAKGSSHWSRTLRVQRLTPFPVCSPFPAYGFRCELSAISAAIFGHHHTPPPWWWWNLGYGVLIQP